MEGMKRLFYKLLCSALIILISSTVWGEDYFTLSNPEIYEIRLVWELKNISTGMARNIKVRLFLPNREELPPYQKIVNYSLSPAGINFKLNGESAEISIPSLAGRDSLKIACNYRVINYTLVNDLNSYIGGEYTTKLRYLQPEKGIESNHPAIIDLAKKITRGDTGVLDKAKSIFAFLNDQLEYKLFDEEDHSALKTLSRGYGSCVDYSYAFIALCRAVEVPARFVQGYRFDPSQITVKEREADSLGHAWAEVQLPNIGWITVDPTYNYQVNGIRKVSYEFFGKILPQDRHLFIGYSTDTSCGCTWESNVKKPAKVQIETASFIRKIK